MRFLWALFVLLCSLSLLFTVVYNPAAFGKDIYAFAGIGLVSTAASVALLVIAVKMRKWQS